MEDWQEFTRWGKIKVAMLGVKKRLPVDEIPGWPRTFEHTPLRDTSWEEAGLQAGIN